MTTHTLIPGERYEIALKPWTPPCVVDKSGNEVPDQEPLPIQKEVMVRNYMEPVKRSGVNFIRVRRDDDSTHLIDIDTIETVEPV